MDVIDGEWIKLHLPDARGSRTALAEAMGLRPDQISKIIKGERKVQAEELPKLLAFFKKPMPGGMAEPQTAYRHAARRINNKPSLEALAQMSCPSVTRPFYYASNVNLPQAGVLAGDYLIISHGGNEEPGRLVLISDAGESAEGVNELRRHFPPYLISLDLAAPQQWLMDTDQSVAIIGCVEAVLRVPAFT